MPPAETKVKASAAASALAGLILWALGRYVFKGAVPDVVASWVYAIIPAAITFAAGYLARHTPRPDLAAVPAPAPGTTPLPAPHAAQPGPGHHAPGRFRISAGRNRA